MPRPVVAQRVVICTMYQPSGKDGRGEKVTTQYLMKIKKPEYGMYSGFEDKKKASLMACDAVFFKLVLQQAFGNSQKFGSFYLNKFAAHQSSADKG